MAILGGIFGSLVDYDMGGVKSRAQIELEVQAHGERVQAFFDNQRERTAFEQVSELREELARANRRLGISEASLDATIDQRNLLLEELKCVDPNNALLRKTGETQHNGQPLLMVNVFWKNCFDKYIKKYFGRDADPADYHVAFKK